HQAVRHLDADLRIGLRVEHDHLELLAVDAAGLVDLGDRPLGGFHLVLPIERLRAGQRHREAEAHHLLGRGRQREGERQAGSGAHFHAQTTIQATHTNLPCLDFLFHAAARSIAFNATSASSVLITSAYFSDMSNRFTACETWLRSYTASCGTSAR